MPAIKDWLNEATSQLIAKGIGTAKLDSEIILAHTLRRSRTYLHAHDDEPLEPREIEIANARLDLRLDRVPIAYIIGHKEFYGRLFHVTPSVLIPRPESETLIDELSQLINQLPAQTPPRLIDVGTGSGCLGITAKLEFPQLDVTLIDTSRPALNVATRNAVQLGATVQCLKSNLLDEYPFSASVILANLPYVDSEWERSPETEHEPTIALFAEQHGLALIDKLIPQAAAALTKGGFLILEADPVQHATIIERADAHGFRLVHRSGYTLSLRAN